MEPRPKLLEKKPAPRETPASSRRADLGAILFLVLFFITLIASGALVQASLELARGEGIHALEVFRLKPTAANLRAYERNLEDASIVARALRPLFQYVQFVWLRDGGAKALIGRNGWLFYKPGYDALLSRGVPVTKGTNDPVAAIVAWRDALAARGVRLLVVAVPNKESMYPDYVTRRVTSGEAVVSPATRDVLTRLKAANVEYVDLFKQFEDARRHPPADSPAPFYLAQDSHWSPAGVKLAAEAVAERLLALGWVKPGVAEYREFPVSVERAGDVLRMLQSPRFERRATLETARCLQVVQTDTAKPYQDDEQANCLVLGDSFLRIFANDEPGSAGFVAHLAKDLKQPLISLVNDGGASTLVRQELFRRPQLLAHAKVVVWEFVERDIQLGTEGWQIVPLPPTTMAIGGPR